MLSVTPEKFCVADEASDLHLLCVSLFNLRIYPGGSLKP